MICDISSYINKVFGFTQFFSLIFHIIHFKIVLRLLLIKLSLKTVVPKKDSKEEKDISCNVSTSGAMEFRNSGRLSDTHRKVVYSNINWIALLFWFPAF